MKIRIVKNQYLNSLFVLMLLSASVHILILLYVTVKSSDLYVMNYFNIIGVSALIPNFLNSFMGNMISIIFIVLLYIIILWNNKIEDKKALTPRSLLSNVLLRKIQK